MSKLKTILLILIGASILFTGCTTLNLREANHELADLYRAKSEAINSRQWEQEMTVNEALSTLADEAAAQGAARSTSDINRISFYRIAATAAWQAGDAKVVAYAAEGSSLCTPENYGKAPRDCGMLSVIPDLASTDELTGRIEEFKKRLDSGQGAPKAQEVVQLFDDIRSRIDALLEKRDRIKKSSAHPQLIEGIDKRTGSVLCSHLPAAHALILEVAGGDSAAHRKAQCDEYRLQVKMKKAGFSQQIAPCLPTGDPVKPPDCP